MHLDRAAVDLESRVLDRSFRLDHTCGLDSARLGDPPALHGSGARHLYDRRTTTVTVNTTTLDNVSEPSESVTSTTDVRL